MRFTKKNKPSDKIKISQSDEEFISDRSAAMLTKSTFMANIALYIVAFLLIFGVIWAYFAEIEQVTVGEGKVIPYSEVKVIQSLDGGIITEISVKEGDIVKKDQTLIRLDKTRYAAEYSEAYAKYLSYLAKAARLTAEAEEEKTISFPKELEQDPSLLTLEKKLFEERKEGLHNEIASLEKSFQLAQDQLDIYKPAVEKGILAKVELVRAEIAANDIKQKIIEKKNEFREKTLTNLNEAKAELSILTETLISLKDKMQRTTITSPVHGIVKDIFIETVSGVVRPGEAIMDIVPLEDALLIQARIRPIDIAFVHIGQPATVKITAYDYSIYGSLQGTVKYISADAIEEKTERPGATTPGSYYLVNVVTTKSYLGNDKHKLPIIPGMTATVHIKTGNKTVLQYLLKPLIKAKQEALRER